MRKLFILFVLGLAVIQAPGQSLDSRYGNLILSARQGQVIELPGLLTENLPSITYQKIVLPGPQFIISDDPEYIRVPEGIAVKERVEPGAVRLYVYNVNGVKEPSKLPRKISPIIKNISREPLHLRMLKYSSQRPSTGYISIGKQGLADYFNSKGENRIRTIHPGETVPLDYKMENNIVGYDELVHGIYEFVIDQPAEVAVVQTDPAVSGPHAYNKIKDVIPNNKKNAGRGLFGISNYSIIGDSVLDTKDGITQLMIADGITDKWIVGKDGSSGSLSKLAGNYGVMYDIELKWRSSDGRGLALITWNSRSGNTQWCGTMATNMMVSGGKFKEGIVALPSDRVFTKGNPEAILIQVFKPSDNGNEWIIRLKYSPPGASCLPTPLIFVPIKMVP